MAVSACRYDPGEEVVWVGDRARLWVGEDGGLVGARAAVSLGSLASLRAAVRRADYHLGLGEEVRVTLYEAPEDRLLLDEEAFFAPPVEIIVLPDRCLVTCTMPADLGTPFDRFELTSRLSAMLQRHRLIVVELSVYDETAITVAHLTCEVRGRGRTLGDVSDAADDLLALWSATMGEGLTAATAADLLRAERPDLLVGQAETSWLEVKRQPYRLEEVDQQFELAKDVAAMGNTQSGGLLVIGLATTNQGGTDVISKVRPIPLALLDASRYRRVIDRLVYPPAEQLDIKRVETEHGKGILLIIVPAQPPEVRPLLVLGTLVGGKLLGSHVSLVRRRGDETTVTHPAALHSLLAAGRVALAGRGESSGHPGNSALA